MAAAFWGAGAAAALAVVAALNERRRSRRTDLDRIDPVDWRSVQMAAVVAVILLLSLGLHSR